MTALTVHQFCLNDVTWKITRFLDHIFINHIKDHFVIVIFLKSISFSEPLITTFKNEIICLATFDTSKFFNSYFQGKYEISYSVNAL
jgi:hypothetical protein